MSCWSLSGVTVILFVVLPLRGSLDANSYSCRLPKEACVDVSSPGCQLPAQRLCQPVPPSPDCQLVLHQVLKGGSGTYCLNVSLTDANSLAVASTQIVVPGRYLTRTRRKGMDRGLLGGKRC